MGLMSSVNLDSPPDLQYKVPAYSCGMGFMYKEVIGCAYIVSNTIACVDIP